MEGVADFMRASGWRRAGGLKGEGMAATGRSRREGNRIGIAEEEEEEGTASAKRSSSLFVEILFTRTLILVASECRERLFAIA